MRLRRKKNTPHEDLVSLSLSEVVIFFLFFCLILLGSLFQIAGFRNGEQVSENKQQLIVDESVSDATASTDDKDQIFNLTVIVGDLNEKIDFLENDLDARLEEIKVLTSLAANFDHENQRLAQVILDLKRELLAAEDKLAAAQEQSEEYEADIEIVAAKQNLFEQDIAAWKEAARKIIILLRHREDKNPDEHPEGNGISPETRLPAVVRLSERSGYLFESNSAQTTEEFDFHFMGEDFDGNAYEEGETGLQQVIDLLNENTDADLVAIEVIGHTDERQLKAPGKGLNGKLLDYAIRRTASEPRPADNVGLGMLRAVAVAHRIEDALKERTIDIQNPAYRNLPVIPLSAGELVMPDGSLTRIDAPDETDDDNQRRVEIRLRSRLRQK